MNNHNGMKRFYPLQLKAIPLPTSVKKYWHHKYEHIRAYEGPKAASSTFKALREHMMVLINKGPSSVLAVADASSEYLAMYFRDVRIRKNGWLRQLCKYAASSPIPVLQLLKLYTTELEPLQTPDESADETHEVLSKQNPGPYFPLLTAWAKLIQIPFGVLKKEYSLHRRGFQWTKGTHPVYWKGDSWVIPGLDDPDPEMKALARMLRRSIFPLMKSHSNSKDLERYLSKWKRTLSPQPIDLEKAYQRMREWLPNPHFYIDEKSTYYGKTIGTGSPDFEYHSESFDYDMWCYLSLRDSHPEIVTHLEEILPESLRSSFDDYAVMDGLLPKSERLRYQVENPETWYSNIPVGFIHHIPKKGTVKRRAIAAPNRFIQVMMKPCQMTLRSITGRLPRNCQFNQRRLDSLIQSSMDHGFVGCWDLSRATDYLPLVWFNDLEKIFNWFPVGSIERWSYGHFIASSRGVWANGLNYSSWKRGQPLGSWPSFEVLTITHHLILEALSVYSGRIDSPYGICGDDNVIFDRNVYNLYGRCMKQAGNPLSYGKSFDNRLVEFTGKLFGRHQQSAYAPDMHPIYYTSLFDYQRASGHYLKWSDLPMKLRGKFCAEVNKVNQTCRPESVYIACQAILGIPCPKLSKESDRLVTNFFARAEREKLSVTTPARVWTRSLDYESIVSLGNLTDHSRSRKGPDAWFVRKYRPYNTNALVRMVAEE